MHLRMKYPIFFFLLIFTLSFNIFSTSQAQNAAVKGFVYTKDNGEPALFTMVFLKGSHFRVQTDVNGYFSIPNITPGNYTLCATTLGYDTAKLEITLKANDLISKKLYISPSSKELSEVVVKGEEQTKKTSPTVSVFTITPKEIQRIPAVGGVPDVAQFLQVLPGVISTGDQGGQLYIRGGSPVQNMVLQDGMIIYNPFHSIGLFSVFDMDIISNATIHAGGFGAEYGGRISAVMNFTTKDGNKKRISGNVAVGPFTAHLMLEGPLFNSSNDNGGNGSFIFSAKTSLLPETSKLLYGYANPNGLPFSFNDIYGKISFSSASGSKVNFFGMHYDDNVSYPNVSSFNWTTNGFGSNFIVIPAGTSMLVQGNFAFSNYSIGMNSASQAFPSSSSINSFNMGTKVSYFFDHNNTMNYGLEIVGVGTAFDFFNAAGQEINDQGNSTELGAYMSYKFVSNNQKLVIEPSFRAQYYSTFAYFSPEPRIDAKYSITEKIRLKFAGGWYSQNLISASNSQDIVNLFYGYMTSPTNLQSTFTTQSGSVQPVNAPVELATHIIGGVEFDLPHHLALNIEVYRKNLNQLIEVNPNKIYQDNSDPANEAQPDYLKKDFIVENGVAQGLDATLKYDYKRLYLWCTYSLASVQLWDGMQSYYPVYDRRNTINLTGSYNFGKNRDWDLSIRWNFGSGFPFTPTAGMYEKLSFTNLNTNPYTTTGTLGILYGAIDSKRLPDYHRLDVSIKKKFELKEHVTLSVSAGATNIYNRDNIFYFDRTTFSRVNQLPILPTISFSLTF